MTTAWDLMIVTRDDAGGEPVDPGDLSLVLAGAELLDLVEAGAAALEGDRIAPGLPTVMEDAMLDQAARSLMRKPPHETVDGWLWRRGEGLAADYLTGLESEGLAVRPRRRWMAVRSDRPVLVDSPAREHAAQRWASGEPVLSALAAAAGVPVRTPEAVDQLADDVTTVLAAVGDAVTELASTRQRRGLEEQAFDNVWRAP